MSSRDMTWLIVDVVVGIQHYGPIVLMVVSSLVVSPLVWKALKRILRKYDGPGTRGIGDAS